jgi:hypothetical protein
MISLIFKKLTNKNSIRINEIKIRLEENISSTGEIFNNLKRNYAD